MVKVIRIIACWVAYLLFAAYSAYMTSKSVSMSFELNNVWVVFIFVMIVSILAGILLKMLINEFKNTIDPSKTKIVLCFLGFILFWGASFTTNVHYMLMSNRGLNVVKDELGHYKNFIDRKTTNTLNSLKEQEADDLKDAQNQVESYYEQFYKETEASMREGFGPRAIEHLKQIERYLKNSSAKFGDNYEYIGSIYDDDKDAGDKGVKGVGQIKGLQNKYANRITRELKRRSEVIKSYYSRKKQLTKTYPLFEEYIDALYAVDIPKIEKIATPEVYYTFQKIPLSTIHSKLDVADQQEIDLTMKNIKGKSNEDIDKGDFRYIVYPSARMFSTFNVWSDMLNSRLPSDMKLFGWILFSLIIDIVTFIIRSFC